MKRINVIGGSPRSQAGAWERGLGWSLGTRNWLEVDFVEIRSGNKEEKLRLGTRS